MALNFLPVVATGLLGLLGPLGTAPVPPVIDKSVSAPITATAAGAVRGTMVMVHGGGWAGPDGRAQKLLLDQPGKMLVDRGWRTVSVDYDEGTAGLQDVLDTVGAELARPTGGLLCLYGESAGAHLALVAAARLAAVDCVIAAGAPTDLQAYRAEAASSGDSRRLRVARAIDATFGTTPQELIPWEPARFADGLHADTLLLRQADDRFIPPEQVDAFVRARPTTQVATLQSGDPTSLADYWLHGSLSDAGRGRYLASVGAFADRAVQAYRARRAAARLRCAQVNRRLAGDGAAALQRALRCLARRDGAARGASAARAATTRVQVRGEVTAARVWSALRARASGRRALAALAAGRFRAVVRRGDPSVVTVRRGR
jgi:acetyl esterase/lipase